MFIAAFSTIAKFSTMASALDRRGDKEGVVRLCWAVKKGGIFPLAVAWMELEGTELSDTSQPGKHRHCLQGTVTLLHRSPGPAPAESAPCAKHTDATQAGFSPVHSQFNIRESITVVCDMKILREKNHVIIFRDAKNLYKYQCPIMIIVFAN